MTRNMPGFVARFDPPAFKLVPSTEHQFPTVRPLTEAYGA